jgi:hypothetical protein
MIYNKLVIGFALQFLSLIFTVLLFLHFLLVLICKIRIQGFFIYDFIYIIIYHCIYFLWVILFIIIIIIAAAVVTIFIIIIIII